MIAELQTAIVLGICLAFMAGPAFFVLIETSIVRGFRAALAFDLGVISSDVFFILLAYLSSYQLLENINNQPGLYVFGGTLLAFYGITIFLKKTKRDVITHSELNNKVNYIGLYVKGFLLNIINIGVLVFWLGLTVVVSPTLEGSNKSVLVFFSTLIITCLFVDILKILLAKKMKGYLRKENTIFIKKVLGIIIIIFGITLIFKGVVPGEGLDPSNIMEKIKP